MITTRVYHVCVNPQIISVLHQKEGGIGKSIPDAQVDREGLTVLESILPC